MKHRTVFFLLFLFAILNVIGQNNCNPKDFRKLILISKSKTISDSVFKEALIIVKRLEKNRCSDYEIKKNGENYIETSLTYLLGEICLIKNDSSAIKEYINYMNRNAGSAEEQICFSFEHLFVRQPKIVLSLIGSDTLLLDDIVWGFVNNRYYGASDPYEKEPNKAFFINSDSPKPVLNTSNYKEIFYKVNPKVKELYKSYKKQIDYLLKAIEEELR